MASMTTSRKGIFTCEAQCSAGVLMSVAKNGKGLHFENQIASLERQSVWASLPSELLVDQENNKKNTSFVF